MLMVAGPISLFRQRYRVGTQNFEFGRPETVQQAVMNGELDGDDRVPGGRSERAADDVIAVQISAVRAGSRSGQWTTCDLIAPEALAEHPYL